LTWFVTLAVCAALVQYAGIADLFVSLPGWFVAAILYVVLSRWFQRSVSAVGLLVENRDLMVGAKEVG
jgi:hypothetical protein